MTKSLEERFPMPEIPADVERSITTPHRHESKHHPPLWLIWKVERSTRTGVPQFPVLDSVCDSDWSARYHYNMVMYPGGTNSPPVKNIDCYVERIPANHRFGSSLPEWQHNVHMAQWKARLDYISGD